MKCVSCTLKLVITIVDNLKTDVVFKAIEEEDVTKSTIIRGRGKSDRNPKLLLDLVIEPQRDIILTVVPEDKANKIFDIIMETGDLSSPQKGIVLIVDLEKAGGLDLPVDFTS